MAETTYLPTDLQRRYRVVLDQAKAGEARVRDLDGTSVLMLPEIEVQTLRRVSAAAANLAAVERVLEASDVGHIDLLQYGEWTWLRVFDSEDLREFARDIREAVIVAVREGSTTVLEEQLRAWKVTAQQTDDPVLRAILQGGADEQDFVEVSRPVETNKRDTRSPKTVSSAGGSAAGSTRAAAAAGRPRSPRSQPRGRT